MLQTTANGNAAESELREVVEGTKGLRECVWRIATIKEGCGGVSMKNRESRMPRGEAVSLRFGSTWRLREGTEA